MTEDSSAEFLTAREVCRVLRLSKDTIYRAIHSGEIPSVRIGEQFRGSRRALEALADGVPPKTDVEGEVVL